MQNGSCNARHFLFFSLLLVGVGTTLSACSSNQDRNNANLAVAERFIDAFYSWSPNELSATLNRATADANRALYYQAWAEAGGYEVQTRRPCAAGATGTIDCAITVTDNIGEALGYVATDTFHLVFVDHNLVGVSFTSDDPPVLQELFGWLEVKRPEVLAGPCKDLFAGGTTPAACVRAVVQGAKDFIQTKP